MSKTVYEKAEGIKEIIRRIDDQLAAKGKVSVLIAGGSGSGKTSEVGRKLVDHYGDDAVLLSADDYYFGLKFLDDYEAKYGIRLSFDEPEAVDLHTVSRHIDDLLVGKIISKPVYSFKKGITERFEKIYPKKVIIFEGLFILNNQVATDDDIKVFVEIGAHGRMIRRLLRDVWRTGQRPADIIKYFAHVVEPKHEEHIESTKHRANVVINNEYKAEEEANRSGLYESQIKFRLKIDASVPNTLDFERIGHSFQLDSYYQPKDRDFSKTGESMRIRNETDRLILTYKGPAYRVGAGRRRDKFEFEIDQETADAILILYSSQIATIKKERFLFHSEGRVFSFDRVWSIDVNGEEKRIGSFFEVRSFEKRKELAALLKKLGVKLEDAIHDSYLTLARK